MKKIIALLMSIVIVFGSLMMLASCNGNEIEDETTTNAEEIVEVTEIPEKPDEKTTDEDITDTIDEEKTTTAEDETADAEEETKVGSENEATKKPESTDKKPVSQNKLPSTKAEILAKYTEVMQYAKTAMPEFEKVEYQQIPADKRKFDGAVFKILLPLAELFMRSEKDARSDPEIHEKGHDMYWFPVYETQKGCLLLDHNKIKTATCDKMSDGNVKITIVLKNEKNPEPTPEGATVAKSATGAMFSPLSRVGVDKTLKEDKAVSIVVKDVEYTLEYYDCTAILVYNPKNNHIVKLDQFMHTLVTVHQGKVLGSNATGSAVLDNCLYIYNFKY